MAKKELKTGEWSKDEVRLLKKMFRNASTKEVAQELGRSAASVQSKATAPQEVIRDAA